MLARMFAAFALMLAAGMPASAQTPARHIEALEQLCLEHARKATPLSELAAAAGARQVNNPLWPEYSDIGHPEHAFSWSDAPDIYVFMLASQWTNIAPRCTVFVRLTGSVGGDLIEKVMDMSTSPDDGARVTLKLEGESMTLGERNQPFEVNLTLGRHTKFGDIVLVSLWRSEHYKPPAPR